MLTQIDQSIPQQPDASTTASHLTTATKDPIALPPTS